MLKVSGVRSGNTNPVGLCSAARIPSTEHPGEFVHPGELFAPIILEEIAGLPHSIRNAFGRFLAEQELKDSKCSATQFSHALSCSLARILEDGGGDREVLIQRIEQEQSYARHSAAHSHVDKLLMQALGNLSEKLSSL